MNSAVALLNPSEAARRLGISAKALRHYEGRGLLTPQRTAAGWRAYGPDEMLRAREIVELRNLGLSLIDVARVLGGDAVVLSRALELHQAVLAARAGQLRATIDSVRRFRERLGAVTEQAGCSYKEALDLLHPIKVAFDLPWPWGGERFELPVIKPVTYIVGPLGSGKTRLAMRLAETLSGAGFVGLDRQANESRAKIGDDPQREARVLNALARVIEDGGCTSDSLLALLASIEADTPQVVDMIEQGLDTATQEAVALHLRRRDPASPPLFCLTRSSAILDLDAVGEHEGIIFCPANHSPPVFVSPFMGARGYEALSTCLATPEVRARTQGVVAVRRTA